MHLGSSERLGGMPEAQRHMQATTRLTTEKRAAIIGCLVEGMSMRAISRTQGVSRNTIDKLLVDLGTACADYQDAALRDLDIARVEADEIWSFCYAKQKNVPEDFRDTEGYGDVWTWVAIDADTKLVPSWLVGERTMDDCFVFLNDLRSRIKVGNRVQLTSDGFRAYPPVVDALWRNGIDYGIVVKEYKSPTAEEARKYSPSTCTSIQKTALTGNPDPTKISTSYVERQNLTMRMGMRRFTRLTNAFSKKIENHAHAIGLHFMHYNFCRTHVTLTKRYGKPTTPAMAAGVATYPWSLTQIAELLD
ncbi:MAG: transposase [Actinomycetia bacterium]|nr:transposase [Actinomycetes bacterium]